MSEETDVEGLKFPTIRRIGAEHYTEHDFKMERIGREQNAETYKKRIEQLESYGYVPFRGPYYYGRREWHGGHHPPGTKKRVPTKVAFAMLLEEHPEVELEPWKPHPHGWSPPPAPGPLFKVEMVSIEPMKMPAGALFTMDYEYGTEEQIKERRNKKARLDAALKDLPGVRRYGEGRGGKFLLPRIWVVLEGEEYRAAIPEEVDGVEVHIQVLPEAQERAEKEAKDAAAAAKYKEEMGWLAKADKIR